MRGEHAPPEATESFISGSSPHARGALLRSMPHIRARGIIPACAGSTRRSKSSDNANRDHPRMRGEHKILIFRCRPDWGSSPHARGALVRPLGDLQVAGIIPACAGSTALQLFGWRATRDHPRMRGEHRSRTTLRTAMQGSSPHARGAPPSPENPVQIVGIIPACAGST